MRWVLALALFAACGEVAAIPDATVPDAPAPDSPKILACGEGEMVCNNACANVMTSEAYCGNCTTQCTPAEGCASGTCVQLNSCANLKAVEPTTTDGIYTNPNNGAPFYCDFTNSFQYDDFVVNPYPTVPAGYSVVRATDLAGAGFAAAFIAFYNRGSGLKLVNGFTMTNCCMGPVADVRYSFGGQIPFVGQGTSQLCNTTYTAGNTYTFGRSGAGVYSTSLPLDYFTQFPPTEVGGCGNGNNMAFFYKRTAIP